MSKKDDRIFKLVDGIETISTITCDNCFTETEMNGDVADVIDEFYEIGWRGIDASVYCPKCIKVNKKKK